MSLDTRIPLGTQIPQSISPINTLGQLARMRAYQQQAEENDMQLQARRRALEDDAFTRQALHDSGGHPDEAIDRLYQAGRSTAAAALSKNVFEWRKSRAEEQKAQLENDGKLLTFSTQILQGVTEDASFQTAKRAIANLWGDRGADVVGHLGEMYDPDRVKQIVAWGTERGEFLKQQQAAIDNANKAWELQLRQAKDWREREQDNREAATYYRKSASQMLSTARDQQQWDVYQRVLAEGGVPSAILAEFGNQFSPAALQRARDLGLTPSERETGRHNRVTEGQRNRELTIRQQEVDQNPQRDMNTRAGLDRRARAERWRQSQMSALEKMERDGDLQRDGNVSRTEAEVKAEVGRRRRAIEQSYREQLGAPTREDAEQWKTRDYQALEDEAGLSREERNTRKLQLEDEYRARIGLKPLLDAEFEATTDPSRSQDLAKLRRTYRSLTGTGTVLERMEELLSQIRKESDPRRQATLKETLRSLRESYRTETGR